jgi:hypothetical protein
MISTINIAEVLTDSISDDEKGNQDEDASQTSHAKHRPRKMGLGTAIIDGFRFLLSLPKPLKYIIKMDTAKRTKSKSKQSGSKTSKLKSR